MTSQRAPRTPPWFFAPGASDATPSIDLPPDEAHHASRVLRVRRGDAVVVFDGAGGAWHAAVGVVGKARVEVNLLGRAAVAPEPRVRLTLLQAALKGDHMDAVVRDATMLGVYAVVPVLTARTVVNRDAAFTARGRERWRRVAIASVKQCRRAVVPSIPPAVTLRDAVAALPAGIDRRVVLAEPAAGQGSVGLDALGDPPAAAALAVGPEGGWTAEELEELAAAGFVRVTLGSLTLRAESAAVVAISMLRAHWKDV